MLKTGETILTKQKVHPWHSLLGQLLEELLPPVGLSVHTNLDVMNAPPKMDVLILKREEREWTSEQLAVLADGIRDSKASHILLEFKYTESINEKVFQQIMGYEYFYRDAQNLKKEHIQSFILSAKHPQCLQEFGYIHEIASGVYQSDYQLLKNITLISLNKLSDMPHNAWIKCFASRQQEKSKAFNLLKTSGLTLSTVTTQLSRFVGGLWQLMLATKGEHMITEMTREQMIEMGEMWGDVYLSHLTTEERLCGLKPANILQALTPAEILHGLKPKEIEDYLKGLKKKK